MNIYTAYVPGRIGGMKYHAIYGETLEDAARANLNTLACLNYDNVMRAGEVKFVSCEYSPSILGGQGGYKVVFEFEQGEPTNGRRLGEAWIYSK